MSDDKNKLISGVFWTAVQNYSGLILSTIISMVLARLLSPAEFGTVAIASVIISFLTMISTMGLGPAIIQRRDLTEENLNSVFTFSILVGSILAIVLFVCSWPIAKFYGNDQLVPVCQILSVQLFFAAINMVPNALMSKNLKFKQMAKRTVILLLITGPTSILAAYLGAGVFALLISPLVNAIGIFVYNRQFFKLKAIRHLDWSVMKGLFSYSTFQFLFQFINFWTTNIDKLIIGKAITPQALGYYQKSYQLVQIPLSQVGGIVYPVLQPIFSKYQDDKQLLAEKYLVIIRLVAAICLPLGILMYFCGSEIIYIFFGPNWEPAVPTFKILSLTVPLFMVLPIAGSFFQASNEIKNLFIIGVINAVVTVSFLSFACFAYKSIEAVAIAYGLSTLSNFLCTYTIMFKRVLHSSLFKALSYFVKPVIGALIVAACLFVVQRFFPDYFVPKFLIKCLLGGGVTAVYLQLSGIFDVISFVKNDLLKRNENA